MQVTDLKETLGATSLWRAVHRTLPVLAMFCAVAIVALTLHAMWLAYLPFPFWDQWFYITTPDYLDTLFEQHNEHRLILFKLIGALDNELAQGTYRVNFAASVLLQVLNAVMLIALGYQAGLRRWREQVWVAAIAFGFLFWIGQWENFFWGFQTQFFAVYAFGTLTFAMLAFSPSWWGAGFACLAAALSVASMSNGVIVAVLMPLLALVMRRPLAQTAAIAVTAAITIFAFLNGYYRVSHHSDPLQSLLRVREVTQYVLTFIGAPLGTLLANALPSGWVKAINLAPAFGALGVVGVSWSTFLLVSRAEARTPARLALLFVILFVGASSFVTALGRIDFGFEQAMSSRYFTPSLILWTATLFLLWSLLKGSRLDLLVPLGATASVFLMVLTQDLGTREAMKVVSSRNGAITAAMTRIYDKWELAKVSPLEDLPRRIEILRQNGFAIFSQPWSGWLGTPLRDHVTFSPRFACQGYVDTVTPVENDTGQPGYRVVGWAWLAEPDGPAKRIIITDETGTVTGYGFTDEARPDVKRAIPAVSDELVGWRGHATLPEGGSPRAYALLPDGRACPLHDEAGN